MNNVQTLLINLYGVPIGTLTLLSGDRSIFAFSEDYLSDNQRPTLSLSFKDEFGEILPQTKLTQTSLTPFFSNLLPEGHMRDYLAEQAGVKKMREFHLLRELGSDLPGAVTATTLNEAPLPVDDAALEVAENSEAKHKAVMRFSLAGVQMKFSAISESGGGLTIPIDGTGGSWIVKLPSSQFERVAENELSMMTLASKIGIDIPEHKLIHPGDIAGLPEGIEALTEPAFAIKRFDRAAGGERIHVEDFAQVFGVYPEKKYKKATYRSIASVLWIETGAVGIQEFVRRLVFNALIGNADMHLKNWSLIYPDRRTTAIAPAYDYVSTIAYINDDEAALKYARQKKMAALSLDELAYLAAKSGAPETLVIRTALETVDRFRDTWKAEKKHLPLTKHTVETIDSHYTGITLVREAGH